MDISTSAGTVLLTSMGIARCITSSSRSWNPHDHGKCDYNYKTATAAMKFKHLADRNVTCTLHILHMYYMHIRLIYIYSQIFRGCQYQQREPAAIETYTTWTLPSNFSELKHTEKHGNTNSADQNCWWNSRNQLNCGLQHFTLDPDMILLKKKIMSGISICSFQSA